MKISLDLSDVAWRDALDIVAEKAHGTVEERGGGVLAVTSPPMVNIQLENVEIRQVIDTIAKSANANVVVGKEVTVPCPCASSDVPWREALDVTVQDARLRRRRREARRAARRVARSPPGPARDAHVPVALPCVRRACTSRRSSPTSSDPSAGEQPRAAVRRARPRLHQEVRRPERALEGAQLGGKIDYIDTANVVIIHDTAQVHDSIKNILARLDVEPLQCSATSSSSRRRTATS
jgi:hypothetical protein